MCSQKSASAGKSLVIPISRTVRNPRSRKAATRSLWTLGFEHRPFDETPLPFEFPGRILTALDLSSRCARTPCFANASGSYRGFRPEAR